MAKNVVITGATSGIGEAIARAYLEKGENIVLTGRRTERLESLKTEFAKAFQNQKVWTFPLDVNDMTMVKTFFIFFFKKLFYGIFFCILNV